MTITTVEVERQAYEKLGYYIVDQPALPADDVRAAVRGMDAVRRGEFATGKSPAPSPWNPGDDVSTLCKIEMPQISDPAIVHITSHITPSSMRAPNWVRKNGAT